MQAASQSPDDSQEYVKTIMILEPEEYARTVLSDYLRHCGYKVLAGCSAEDAYAVLRDGGTIDTILADVQLDGDLDGARLLQALRKSHPEIDVILTYGPNTAADRASEFCDHGPLKKPYSREEVVLRIRRLRGQ